MELATGRPAEGRRTELRGSALALGWELRLALRSVPRQGRLVAGLLGPVQGAAYSLERPLETT